MYIEIAEVDGWKQFKAHVGKRYAEINIMLYTIKTVLSHGIAVGRIGTKGWLGIALGRCLKFRYNVVSKLKYLPVRR